MSRFIEKSDENPDYWGEEEDDYDTDNNRVKNNDDDDAAGYDVLGDDEEVVDEEDEVVVQKSLDDFYKEQQLKREQLKAKSLGVLVARDVIDSTNDNDDDSTRSDHSRRQQQQQLQKKNEVVRSPLLSDASMRFEPVTIGKSSSRFLRIDAAATTITSTNDEEHRLVVFGGEDVDGTHYGDGFYLSRASSVNVGAVDGGGVHFGATAMKLGGQQQSIPPSTSGHTMTFVPQSNVLILIGGVLRDNTRLNRISYLANARSLSSSSFGIVHPANPDVKEVHGSTVSKGRRNPSFETFDFCSCVSRNFFNGRDGVLHEEHTRPGSLFYDVMFLCQTSYFLSNYS